MNSATNIVTGIRGELPDTKYLPYYTQGGKPQFIEGDPFITRIPLPAKPEAAAESSGETVEKILQLLRSNPRITQERIAAKTGLGRRGIEWNLSELKKNGSGASALTRAATGKCCPLPRHARRKTEPDAHHRLETQPALPVQAQPGPVRASPAGRGYRQGMSHAMPTANRMTGKLAGAGIAG